MVVSYYPKVTIVSCNPLRNDTGNGILMRSLFHNWPKDRLTQTYFPVFTQHVPNVLDCSNYRAIDLTGHARPMLPSPLHHTDPQHRRRLVSRQSINQMLKRRKVVFRWLRAAREILSARSQMIRALQRQLRDMKPDIVYALVGNYSLTKITMIACRQLGIPLFLHVPDDFVTSLYKDFPFSPTFERQSQKWFSRAISSASGLAAISPIMAEEFRYRYDRNWDWFTTLIDAGAYDTTPRPADGTIRLVYAGNLGLARWESLRTLALCLKRLADRKGIKSCLIIHSSADQLAEHREALSIPQVTELRGWVAHEELPFVFQQSDILVHVESFQPSIANYTRLSLSTKLSQYMTAGRPVLAFGPRDLGSIRVVIDAKAGVCIGENHPGKVEHDLEQLLKDRLLRSELAKNGRSWGEANVDIEAGTQRFHRRMMDALVHFQNQN